MAFFIYFFSFTACGFLLFGQNIGSYKGFIDSAESIFAFSLGDFDFAAMQGAQKILGPLFFFAFIAVMYVGMMSMFLTIIADSFTQVKANASLRSNDYEIVDFMWKRFKGVIGVK